MITYAPKKILCVDDLQDDCDLSTFILTDAGYEVESAQSVSNALQRIKGTKFSLCLFDLSLSDGTGLELLEKVRALDPHIPLIVCSGDIRNSTQQQAMRAGAQAFFTKPIDYDFLLKTIAQLT